MTPQVASRARTEKGLTSAKGEYLIASVGRLICKSCETADFAKRDDRRKNRAVMTLYWLIHKLMCLIPLFLSYGFLFKIYRDFIL